MKQVIRISSILAGVNPLQQFGLDGGYDSAIGIDPDFPLADSGSVERSLRTAGVLRPAAYAKFSGSNVAAVVRAIITNPKDAKVYAIISNGKIVSYTSALGTETLVGTCAGSNAEGAFYYNNYIYITGTGASKDDVSRYGPLDGSPALTDNVWKGATLGSQTALGNSTYPVLRDGTTQYPKHVGCVHVDGNAYVLDFDGASSTSSTRGKGLVHKIATKYGAAEGDTNDTSQYNVLDLPYGFYPTAIRSYGTDVAILAVQTVGNVLEVGKSFLFLWDPTDVNTFYRMVPLADPIATALLSNNGSLYIWGGRITATGGYSLYQYQGGLQTQEIVSFDEGHPPPANAVDALGDKIVWGSWVTYPDNAAVVWAFGSKDFRIPAALHCIARSTASATTSAGMITALKYAEQRSNALPGMLIAWEDGSAYGIDALSTTYQTHYWRSERYNIGAPFNFQKLHLPLGVAVAANMTLDATIYSDDANGSVALTTVNNTNFSGKRRVSLPGKLTGSNNIFLQLKWSGTALLPVLLPIDIEIDVLEKKTA